jgi:hypothetical protein
VSAGNDVSIEESDAAFPPHRANKKAGIAAGFFHSLPHATKT